MASRLSVDMRLGLRLLAAVLLLLALGGAALSYSLLSDYEILDKGQLLSYTSGKIYKVRFGGWLTLYLEPEVRPSLDLLNAYLLSGIAFISLTFSAILASVVENRGGARLWFFVISFFGASYLAADEMLGIHESVGHNLRFLAGLPLIEKPDDAVIVFLALPATLVLLLFRSVILASRKSVALLGLGLLCFLLAAVADIFSLPFEEICEVLATACLAAAMIGLGLHHARPSILPRGD